MGAPVRADVAKTDVVSLRVAVERVYARAVVSQLEGVVALMATLSTPDGAVSERRYRGSITRVNWAGSGGEAVAALNEALAAALSDLSRDACRWATERVPARPTGASLAR
jgi:hypothetical protein